MIDTTLTPSGPIFLYRFSHASTGFPRPPISLFPLSFLLP